MESLLRWMTCKSLNHKHFNVQDWARACMSPFENKVFSRGLVRSNAVLEKER